MGYNRLIKNDDMKVTMILLQSLNGFISKDLNDDLSWGSKSDKMMFKQISEEIGAIIVGSKTYNSLPKHIFKTRKAFVLTSRGEDFEPHENVTFLNTSPSELLEKLEKNGFKEILIAGGNSIYSQFLENNLVDRIFLTISPIIFNNGIIGLSPKNEITNFKITKSELRNSGEIFLILERIK